MSKAFGSIKRGLLQAIEHAEGHAPQPEKQRFASVWDALADTPQEAARMKARSALRMSLEASRERGMAQGELMPYPVAIEPGNDTTAWDVVVPDLPGCFSAGDTLEEAMTQAEEAVTGSTEVLKSKNTINIAGNQCEKRNF
jgi:predicted RNase H-like HicB family nuclease